MSFDKIEEQHLPVKRLPALLLYCVVILYMSVVHQQVSLTLSQLRIHPGMFAQWLLIFFQKTKKCIRLLNVKYLIV